MCVCYMHCTHTIFGHFASTSGTSNSNWNAMYESHEKRPFTFSHFHIALWFRKDLCIFSDVVDWLWNYAIETFYICSICFRWTTNERETATGEKKWEMRREEQENNGKMPEWERERGMRGETTGPRNIENTEHEMRNKIATVSHLKLVSKVNDRQWTGTIPN